MAVAPPRAPAVRGKGLSHLEMDDMSSRADDRRAARSDDAGPALTPHAEPAVDTGLRYRPGEPVHVWVRHREHRVSVSDRGAALEKAGAVPGWRRACRRVQSELNVNITRTGVVCLPVVPVGPSEPEVVERIGRASLAFFQELLELGRP